MGSHRRCSLRGSHRECRLASRQQRWSLLGSQRECRFFSRQQVSQLSQAPAQLVLHAWCQKSTFLQTCCSWVCQASLMFLGSLRPNGSQRQRQLQRVRRSKIAEGPPAAARRRVALDREEWIARAPEAIVAGRVSGCVAVADAIARDLQAGAAKVVDPVVPDVE